jgi:hypothetical protein
MGKVEVCDNILRKKYLVNRIKSWKEFFQLFLASSGLMYLTLWGNFLP